MRYHTRGLSYDWGTNLWVGNYSNDYIYRTDYRNGSIRSFFLARHDMSGGLAIEGGRGGYDPQAIWASTTSSPTGVWRHHLTTGSIYRSFNPGRAACDLAWDYENELIWAGAAGSDFIYGYKTTGSVVASFHRPASYPWGMCYYERVLWIACTTPTHRIYKVDCPINVSVTPTSVGNIKALYK